MEELNLMVDDGARRVETNNIANETKSMILQNLKGQN